MDRVQDVLRLDDLQQLNYLCTDYGFVAPGVRNEEFPSQGQTS